MSKKEENYDEVAEDMFGVFEQDSSDVELDKDREGGSVMFNPNAKDAENQTWRGLIKFLPNLNSKEMNNHTIKKISYWIPEPNSRGFRWDSPRSVGDRCIVNDKYWDLKNSGNAKLEKKANKINYQPRTFALIQIIKDAQDESNNGDIKVWALPRAIENKINEQIYPTQKDIDMGSVANNVFNPLKGFPMILKIGVKNVENDSGSTKQYRDYDSCSFKSQPLSIILEGEEKPVSIDKAKKSKDIQKKILETIKSGPNLQDYAYQEPTEKDERKVERALKALVSGDISDYENSVDSGKPDDSGDSDDSEKSDSSKKETSENSEKNPEKEEKKPEKKTKKSKPKKTKKSEKSDSSKKETSDDDDDILNELGIDDD